jgi:hypothetical protein
VTGQVPMLGCLLARAHGHERSCSVMFDIKWLRSPRDPALGSLAWFLEPPKFDCQGSGLVLSQVI